MAPPRVAPKSTTITIASGADIKTFILQSNQNFDAIWKAIKDITRRIDDLSK